MNFLPMGLWPVLTNTILGGIRAVIGRAACRLTKPRYAMSGAIRAGTNFDPHRFSRAQLLAELLAPAPSIGPHELREADDAESLQPLSGPVEAAVARRLLAARELMCRDALARLQDRPVMNSPELLMEWLRLHCAGLDYEVFLVLYLDIQQRLIAAEQLFRGTLAQVGVYPREILKQALFHGANAVALAHNHPGGSVQASAADQQLTSQLKNALALVDIRVIDHIIVAGDQHYSFAQHGLM
jgi:DNA repair protein RadC